LSLPLGARLGPYEILSPLGAGGMGEVYRARDTKLNRDVAIKVLPDLFASDAERLARFTREAQTLAALNHPNIAHIHGFEESNGVRALVMELVKGDDLSQRIARGAIPIDEALPLAKQIADALEAAHEQGIIHRDLKPANIKVRSDGTVKVLDFGLAKLVEPNGAGHAGGDRTQSPTITSPVQMTGLDVILGTAAYMSPEQAKGRAADKRADIWAFGVVLFEMLTGRAAFEGETISDVLAKVIEREPDWSTLPANASLRLRELLQRCVKKDPKARLRDIGDARVQIDELISNTPDDVAVIVEKGEAPRWRRALPWTVAASSFIGAVVLLAILVPWRKATSRVARFSILTPGAKALAIDNNNPDIAMSPDGTRIVFATGVQPDYHWYVRTLDALVATPLPTLPPDAENPFVSPDNLWMGFSDETSARKLMKVPIVGGPVVTICDVPNGDLRGASWGPGETIVFGTSGPGGRWRVSANGGKPETLTTPADRSDHIWPEFLPGGRAVLFTIMPAGGNVAKAQIAVVNLTTGEQTILIPGASYAKYSPTGHLIYGVGGTLRAVGFDLNRLAVITSPVPVVDGVVTKNSSGVADFDLASDGSLVYVAGDLRGERTLAWVDRTTGREEPINVPPHAFVYARLSPDGTHVALDARDEQNDIWIWDIARKTLEQLTNDPGVNRLPIWTPDSKRVAFTAERDDVESVYWQAFDGSGAMERLSSGAQSQTPQAFSPDGKHLIFGTPAGRPPYDLGVLSLGATRTAAMLLHSTASETNADLSVDGRWLAYQSNESGTDEVYVRPFPDVDTERRLVSTAGGTRPLWSRTGRELFYYVAGTIMAVPVSSGAHITFGIPQPVVKGYAVPLNSGRDYDVSADGQRFLLIKDAPTPDGQKPAAPEIHLVLNWQEELKQRVPTR
jgi:serine/threonine-protein kinase